MSFHYYLHMKCLSAMWTILFILFIYYLNTFCIVKYAFSSAQLNCSLMLFDCVIMVLVNVCQHVFILLFLVITLNQIAFRVN